MLDKENKIEKRNDLNQLRAKSMTVQQLRIFAIYLSKINARDEATRKVRFKLADFQKIMGIGRLNIASLRAAFDGLLCQTVHIPTGGGGMRSFQLFKECEIGRDETTGEWYVTIDAHDRALPLFFDFKERYFTYEVGNVLRLGSVNQIRMYEVLKQREHMAQPVTIPLPELRALLGIDEKKYQKFNNFRVWVLDKTQNELLSQTDICFEYEPVKRGRSVVAIAFTIKKNVEALPQICIEEFIAGLPDPEPGLDDGPEDPNALFVEALPRELGPTEVEALRALAVEHIDIENGIADAEMRIYNYLDEKTRLMYAQKKGVKPANYFAWLRKAVANDWK